MPKFRIVAVEETRYEWEAEGERADIENMIYEIGGLEDCEAGSGHGPVKVISEYRDDNGLDVMLFDEVS